MSRVHKFAPAAFAVLLLSACSSLPQGEAKFPTGSDRGATGNNIYSKPDSIFGPGGLSLSGTRDTSSSTPGIRVNAYLWRAAIDTVSFMPLASADPFGGVILTDWYATPATPNERTKLNVFILDGELSANGVSVKVFRQVKKGRDWVDASVDPATGTGIEDAILTRARQMRVAEQDK